MEPQFHQDTIETLNCSKWSGSGYLLWASWKLTYLNKWSKTMYDDFHGGRKCNERFWVFFSSSKGLGVSVNRWKPLWLNPSYLKDAFKELFSSFQSYISTHSDTFSVMKIRGEKVGSKISPEGCPFRGTLAGADSMVCMVFSPSDRLSCSRGEFGDSIVVPPATYRDFLSLT